MPYVDNLKRKSFKILDEALKTSGKRANLTIGYGTLLPLTEEEGELLLKHRLEKSIQKLIKHKPFILNLKPNAQIVLGNMVYNLGVPKLLNFKRMFKALENFDYETAAKEMIDSKWYRENTNRVDRLVKIMLS